MSLLSQNSYLYETREVAKTRNVVLKSRIVVSKSLLMSFVGATGLIRNT